MSTNATSLSISLEQDRRFMAAAIGLARRGLGVVWPNPSVGALIVTDIDGNPVVAGQGVTDRPGGPHAEVNALRQAGSRARGATCYVTLEPCSHHGRTPPCSAALIKAGVARVVIGSLDPNPRVSGRGASMLREAGIEVVNGVLEAETAGLHRGFIARNRLQRPEVFLKIAVSSDGYIGKTNSGQVAISSPLARRQVHGMRANHDAILVGIGTALADDPELTCRLPGMADRSPVRIVIDRDGLLPIDSKLVRSAADVPVWIIAANDADPGRLDALTAAGVLVIRIPAEAGRIAPATALRALGARGITRLMVEGGARIASSFVIARLIDEACLVFGPENIGEGGVPALAGLDIGAVMACDDFQLVQRGSWGPDRYYCYTAVRES